MVLISNRGCSGIGWFRNISGRDEDMGFISIRRFEGPGLKDLTNPAEPSGCVCPAMPSDVDEVLAKVLVAHVSLDFRQYDMFHLFTGTVLNPAVLDDTDLLGLLVDYLERPRPPAGWCIGTNVVQ